jgi:hypothetical protein
MPVVSAAFKLFYFGLRVKGQRQFGRGRGGVERRFILHGYGGWMVRHGDGDCFYVVMARGIWPWVGSFGWVGRTGEAGRVRGRGAERKMGPHRRVGRSRPQDRVGR